MQKHNPLKNKELSYSFKRNFRRNNTAHQHLTTPRNKHPKKPVDFSKKTVMSLLHEMDLKKQRPNRDKLNVIHASFYPNKKLTPLRAEL
jgi:hypothetical protein